VVLVVLLELSQQQVAVVPLTPEVMPLPMVAVVVLVVLVVVVVLDF